MGGFSGSACDITGGTFGTIQASSITTSLINGNDYVENRSGNVSYSAVGGVETFNFVNPSPYPLWTVQWRAGNKLLNTKWKTGGQECLDIDISNTASFMEGDFTAGQTIKIYWTALNA